MSDIDDLISTKELASKLKVTEPLLKKLINDFAIETQRVDRRAHLNSKAATTVKEILALRASGKKNSEIKELFESSKQINPKTLNKKPEKQEQVTEAKQDSKDSNKKNTEKEAKKPEIEKKKPKKPLKKKEAQSKTQNPKPNDSKPKENSNKEESQEISSIEQVDYDEDVNSPKEEELEEASIMDISGYLLEENEAESNELKSLLNDDDDENEITDFSDIEEVDDIEENRDENISERKIRRRQFSFKYIQRQIANDSKRINYIKQKLKRGRLSTKETMMLEDSLHHRSILLSGWIQLLRWVKN